MVELRRALDDRAQEIVKTVPRRGYVFTAVVTTEERGTGVSAARARALEETASAQSENDGLVVAQRVPGRYYLPLPRTTLMGRERELLTVRHLLLSPDTGLVTLTGTG